MVHLVFPVGKQIIKIAEECYAADLISLFHLLQPQLNNNMIVLINTTVRLKFGFTEFKD